MLEAALAAKLTDPFVHVLELGDYSVIYRVAGFLGDVKLLLTTRSNLRAKMLITLHEAEVEIVSPTFMNQRQMDNAIRVLPQKKLSPYPTSDEEPDTKAESLIFDKADAVAQLEELRAQRESLREEITGLEAKVKAKGETIGPWIEQRITRIRQEEERLCAIIEKTEGEKID